ncbi:hypothetical protein Tco_1218389 [Tanacetum coccineum]
MWEPHENLSEAIATASAIVSPNKGCNTEEELESLATKTDGYSAHYINFKTAASDNNFGILFHANDVDGLTEFAALVDL